MFDYSKLIGKIAERFTTRKELAKALHISGKALSRKIHGKNFFTQKEILLACIFLEIPLGEIPEYFFTVKVPLTEQM